MTKIEEIEEKIKSLSPEELDQFRTWYSEFDSDAWDRQIEKDAQSGRLEPMAREALAQHKKGESKPL